MVQSFGGRVTGSVSGKTNILIVGKQPGMSKVGKARTNPKITLMSIHDLNGHRKWRCLSSLPTRCRCGFLFRF